MYEIPKFLRNKEIYEYLYEISLSGIDKYNDFLEYQEEELSRIIVDSLGNDVFDILDLEDDDLPINYKSSSKILNNIYKKFSRSMDELLYEIKQDKFYYEQRCHGFISFLDRKTGEIEWR